MAGIRILGTGRFLPAKVVTNDDFTAIVETSDEWISTRTGMKNRHIAHDDEPAWHMGLEAARKALKAAGIEANDIDMLIATTVTPDYITPSVACIIQSKLEAQNAFAFDINAACAGFTYAVDMARRYLATGGVKTVLIVSTETLSQVVDYADRSTCVLFGDGAGACVLSAADTVFGVFLHCDPAGTSNIYAKNPRRSIPFFDGAEPAAELLPFPTQTIGSIHMDGRDVYKLATKAMPEAVIKSCENAGVAVNDLALLIPHQANLRIIETAAKNLGMPMKKIYVNIHDYGNTSSVSVVIALDECARAGTIKRGDLICLVGFGAGFIYGACVLEY